MGAHICTQLLIEHSIFCVIPEDIWNCIFMEVYITAQKSQ